MEKSGTMSFKNLRYLCLVGVIALGLMTIVGSSGGGGGEDTSTPTVTDGTGDTGDGGTGDGDTGDGTTTTVVTATSFNISAAVGLLALEQTVSATSVKRISSDGRSLFTYKIVNEGLERPLTREESLERAKSRSAFADEDNVGGNLLAYDAQNNAWSVIDSDYSIKVMYSVVDPSGEYVYLALDTGWWGEWDGNDYTQFIAQENCAFFRLKIPEGDEDTIVECVKEGVFVQNMDQTYMQTISSDQKPIQFDDERNMYFTATNFTREEDSWEDCWYDPTLLEDVCETQYNYWISSTTWNPRIYKMAKDTDEIMAKDIGEITAITQDIQSVDYFLALPTGEIAYHSFEQAGGGGPSERLWIWQDGVTIDLSSGTLGNAGVDFFGVDTKNAVTWGEWNTKGIWFARPLTEGGVEKATLDTNLFGGNQHGDSKPRRVILADDGRLYGVFESWLWDHEENLSYTVMSVYQILPYDGVPKLELTLSANWFWWDWMGNTPFQVSKGFLYYVDIYDPADGWGTRDIIKMVYLPDRTTSQILDTGEGRYEIYSWRLSGDILHFSALDKSRTIVVTGKIDTLKVKQGMPVEDFLTIEDTTSALGAISQIQDIEILTPQQPETDPGGNPVVQQWHTSPENLYSVSMDFTKYMNKQSVEDNLSFVDEASNPTESIKIWIYKSLHLVPDLDDTGLLDSSTTTPLEFATDYTITLSDATIDAYNWALDDADGALPKSVSFTTKPENGWYHSPETDSTIEAISTGGVAKYAGPQAEWTKETFDLGVDVPDNVRIEFSAKNFGWEGVNIVLWNKTDWDSNDDDNWRAITAQYRLGNWSNLEYKTGQDQWGWYTSNWKDGNTPMLFNGSWMRYQIDIYGRNMTLSYSENGTDWTKVESFSVTDLMNRVVGNDYYFFLRVVEPMVMDNIQVSTLNADRTLAGDEGDILDLAFTADITLPNEVPDDTIGFDYDLNATLNFGNW